MVKRLTLTGIIFTLVTLFRPCFGQLNHKLLHHTSDTTTPIRSQIISHCITYSTLGDQLCYLFVEDGMYTIKSIRISDGVKMISKKFKPNFKRYEFNGVPHFEIDEVNNRIYIIDGNDLVAFDFNTGAQIWHTKVKGTYLFAAEDGVFIGRYYAYHRDDALYRCGIIKFNLKGERVDSVQLDVPYIEYTHFNFGRKNLISFNGKNFVVAALGLFQFYEINKDLEVIDTIQIDKPNWREPSKKLSKKYAATNNGFSKYLAELSAQHDSLMSCIEYITYIDSNKIIIQWFQPDNDPKTFSSPIYIDVVEKINGHWIGLNSMLHKISEDVKTKKFNEGGFPIHIRNGYVVYYSNKIINITLDVCIPVTSEYTWKSYWYAKQEVSKTAPLGINFWTFSWSP